MTSSDTSMHGALPKGVMLNAYPDSIGRNLADIVTMLRRPEFKGVFSLFYILPTFFNSDLDRGFSVIDYDLNAELVSPDDLAALEDMGIGLKFDLVLNHLSVGSPQFQDMLKRGDASEYRDFFIDWNEFWDGEGEVTDKGYVMPRADHLEKLFMRKPGLPILFVRFPDGSERPYWNTFYQKVTYVELEAADLTGMAGLGAKERRALLGIANEAVRAGTEVGAIDFGPLERFRGAVTEAIEAKRRYLGQMDLNAKSEKVWEFYDETLRKLRGYGGRMIRLDAFAYLHKEPGQSNFFNKPGTWDYLDRLKRLAGHHDLIVLPEIHSQYGGGLHEEVAGAGFPIYDFFFPGLVIDALDRGVNQALVRWIGEVVEKKIQTVNMLGCHDGIPVLDLKGNGAGEVGLLSDPEIGAIMDRIVSRGGRIKNLYGPDGRKISYYQVNATFFSALGEDERKMLLARAIQIFMPGIPQVWYLDLFAGSNDYAAADGGGAAGHKEINRTTLLDRDIEQGLKRLVVRSQLDLLRLRNTSSAFDGRLEVHPAEDHCLHLTWRNGTSTATLDANLRDVAFCITHRDETGVEGRLACH